MEDKDALIMELWAEVQKLRQEILGQKPVKKTTENSSIPPSSEIKGNIESSKTTKKKQEVHKNGGRKSVETLATYLRYSHAISYERLSQMMGEVYGIKISEGGLAELFKRVKTFKVSVLERCLSNFQN